MSAKRYTQEFKDEAVRQVIAKALGQGQTLLEGFEHFPVSSNERFFVRKLHLFLP